MDEDEEEEVGASDKGLNKDWDPSMMSGLGGMGGGHDDSDDEDYGSNNGLQ